MYILKNSFTIHKQKLIKLKGEMKKYTIIVGNFNSTIRVYLNYYYYLAVFLHCPLKNLQSCQAEGPLQILRVIFGTCVCVCGTQGMPDR